MAPDRTRPGAGTEVKPTGVAGADLVTTIDGMAKKHRPGGVPGQWKGEAVQERPGGEAERAAERAEGNGPVRAEAEDERLREGGLRGEPEDGHRPTSDQGDPEEDLNEAAEAHQARDAAERPPRGKL